MTMNDQYETGNSSVKISDGAKGSTVEVKVYAKPLPVDEDVEAAYRRIRHVVDAAGNADTVADLQMVGKYITKLRAAVPDVDAAQKQVNAIHLKTAAMIERNGGVITYDPDRKLLAAWEEMEDFERAKNS